jgi:hypothetical protein
VDVAPDIAVHGEQVAHVRAAVGAEVDDRVESLARERRERAGIRPVAGHLANTARPEARPRAAVEEHDLVAVREEQLDGGHAHEASPADDQHPHRPLTARKP